MRIRTQLRIPKEHGAWGMLYIPFLLGALVAFRGGGRLLLLGVSMTLVFIGRESVLAWWRARSRDRDPGSAPRLMLIYLGLAGVAALPLVARDRLWGMVPLGAAAVALLAWNAQQAVKREERTLFTQVLGITGLTLAAPAAHYVGLGRWEPVALWLWGACLAYFVSSVFYVKLRVLTAHAKAPAPIRRARTQCALYHAALAVALVTLVAGGWLSWWILLAYVPLLLRALYSLLWPRKELVLKQVGYLEVLYSVVFLAFAVLAFRP